MKLCYPGTTIAFTPSPAYFLGDFDVYDREETVGAYLDGFNPNNQQDVRKLLKEMFFHGHRAKGLSAPHRAVLVQVLVDALKNPSYEFSSSLEANEGGDDTFCLPFSWTLQRPRMFFEEAYKLAYELWRNDVETEMPHPNDLYIRDAESAVPGTGLSAMAGNSRR